MKKAVIIGAGFGGLALGLRLQSAGIPTTIVEARETAGGVAHGWRRDGYIFDAGPTIITDPDCLAQLWRLSGQDMAQDVRLIPVMPFYRLSWPDGTTFDYSADDAALFAEIARLNPADVEGYHKFLRYAGEVYQEFYVRQGARPFLGWRETMRAAPGLVESRAWRSVHAVASSFVKNDLLRQALSFHTMFIGGNPTTTSGLYALIHRLERETGVWFAKGGTQALVQAMVTQFERIGGTLRLGDPVASIETVGDRADAIVTRGGMRLEADMIATNADIMHSYRDLLRGHPRGKRQARALASQRWSPGFFILHFGVKGAWPGIPHHNMLFGPRFADLFTDIHEHGVLPQDFALFLHHPTVTDPELAPPGHSTFQAVVPVAHLGKLPVDWTQVGPVLTERVLAEIERRLIPDLKSRITMQFHTTPADFAHDFSAHMGSACSLAPTLVQSAWRRPHHRDDVISNLYLVGAGTHPGAGIPGVVASARAAAGLMLEDQA